MAGPLKEKRGTQTYIKNLEGLKLAVFVQHNLPNASHASVGTLGSQLEPISNSRHECLTFGPRAHQGQLMITGLGSPNNPQGAFKALGLGKGLYSDFPGPKG